MKNLRNKNAPPNADLVQVYLQSSWDIVTDVYAELDNIQTVAEAINGGTLDQFLSAADIDTLAEFNAIMTDWQAGRFSTQGEAEAGLDNTTTMTPLRVAQAIAVLAAGLLNNYTAIVPPTVTDDSNAGYSVGSYWIDTVGTEVYRCIDAGVGAAVWVLTTLTSDELATVALTGDSDDLIQGVTNLLMTVAERSKLVGIEDGATADQNDTEIAGAYANIVPAASQGEAEAGTEGALRTWSPLRVGQAIAALAQGGGGGLVVEFKNASFTAEAGKKYKVDTTSGAVVVTLPAGTDLDNIVIQDVGHYAATNNITINPNGAETIDDDTTFVIDQNEGDVDIGYISADTNWYVSADGSSDLVNAADYFTKYRGQNLQTGTAYELVLDDAGKVVEMNNAAANTLTIPANSAVAFPVDTRVDVIQYGAGQTTIAITTDTLTGTATIGAQYQMVSLWKRAATEWVVIGGA